MPIQPQTTRRGFLKSASALGALCAFPSIIPSTALGKDGAVAPSERVTVGMIGTGGRGRSHLQSFLAMNDVQIVAIADPDDEHAATSLELIANKYGNDDCKAFRHHDELLALKDLDAVCIATPDHWHARATIDAANAKKHIYCEKPLSNSIYEGRRMIEAVRGNKVVFQTGTQERSGDRSRYTAELVRSGVLGKLHTMHINLPTNQDHHMKARAYRGMPRPEPIPESLDWNYWLGHTPQVPYSKDRCHFLWRFILTYGGGEMTDRGAHVIDIAQLGNNTDVTTPVEIEGKGIQTPDCLYNTFWDCEFVNTYANGVKMVGTADPEQKRGVKFEGTDGWIFVEIHGGKLTASNPKWIDRKLINSREEQKKFFGKDLLDLGRVRGQQAGHQHNFIAAVKSGKDPIAPVEVGHSTGTICHLNNIAFALKRKLKWDPAKEQFIGDDEANKLLKPVMREPFLV